MVRYRIVAIDSPRKYRYFYDDYVTAVTSLSTLPAGHVYVVQKQDTNRIEVKSDGSPAQARWYTLTTFYRNSSLEV